MCSVRLRVRRGFCVGAWDAGTADWRTLVFSMVTKRGKWSKSQSLLWPAHARNPTHTVTHAHTRTSPTPVRPSSSVLSAYTQQNTAERSAGSLYMETPPRVSRQYLPTSRLLRDERDLPREISIMPSPSRCCAPHPQPARPLSTLHAPHSLASAQSRAPLRP